MAIRPCHRHSWDLPSLADDEIKCQRCGHGYQLAEVDAAAFATITHNWQRSAQAQEVFIDRLAAAILAAANRAKVRAAVTDLRAARRSLGLRPTAEGFRTVAELGRRLRATIATTGPGAAEVSLKEAADALIAVGTPALLAALDDEGRKARTVAEDYYVRVAAPALGLYRDVQKAVRK